MNTELNTATNTLANTSETARPSASTAFLKMKKWRSDSVFAKLTPEQHVQLLDWLHLHSYEKVQGLMAKEAPEGFGLTAQITSLHRYFHEATAAEWLCEDLTPELLEVADRSLHDPSPYYPIAARFIERRLAFFAANPESNINALTNLYKLVLKEKDRRFKEIQFATKHPETAAQLNPLFMSRETHSPNSKEANTVDQFDAPAATESHSPSPKLGEPGPSAEPTVQSATGREQAAAPAAPPASDPNEETLPVAPAPSVPSDSTPDSAPAPASRPQSMQESPKFTQIHNNSRQPISARRREPTAAELFEAISALQRQAGAAGDDSI